MEIIQYTMEKEEKNILKHRPTVYNNFDSASDKQYATEGVNFCK